MLNKKILFALIIGLAISFTSSAEAYIITFYTNDNPEISGMDGRMWESDSYGDTWANIRAASGDGASSARIQAGIQHHETSPKWRSICRSICVFDTSSLDDNCTIVSATFSLYGYEKVEDTDINPTYGICSAAPASDTEIAAGDYDSLGTTPYCDSPITHGDFDITGYNDWSLNSAGLAAISKTGTTNIGIREEEYDMENDEPEWIAGDTGNGVCSHYFNAYAAEAGIDYAPKLVVVYTLSEPIPEPTSFLLLGFGVVGIAIFRRRLI